MRKSIPLNFDWKYSPAYSDEMMKKSFDDSSFTTVEIPHTNRELPLNYFDERDYQFVSCYRKHFKLPKEAFENGRRVLLHFEGAANYAVVSVNGKTVGSHKGGYTPFVFDITDCVNKAENVIAVMLDSTERPEIPPFGNVVDYLVYGGIYREVWLEITESTYIENVFVKTPNALALDKTIEADITLNESAQGQFTFSLCEKGKVLKVHTFSFEGKMIHTVWKIGDAKLWDVDDPNLYTLRITYQGDNTEVRFGFREARFTRTGFVLNGRPIQLLGLNRHQSYPYVGYAMPASAQRDDADTLKYRLGCNFVRTAHYPDSIHFLDRCDEIGLLVFTEMPSWQFLGEGEWRDNCLDNIESMVVRDRNHPCVVLWGVRVNEGVDCDEFYKQTNALARKLDPTRQTGGVRNFPRSHLLEDVYTYNDFSHAGKAIKLLPPAIVTGLTKPYLVTEHNGHMFPTKSFDNEPTRTEHALRHLRVQNTAFGNKRISGATGWCFADYNTHKDFGSGDKICYHGVLDMFRMPKLAASVYASQQDKVPVMECSSSMDIGDHPGGSVGPVYIFTNCDYVKVYKNGELKSIAYPNKKRFPNLPHPPICPEDYIGDALIKTEHLDEKAAEYLKVALVAASQYGFAMPPYKYLYVAAAFLKGRMSVKQIYNLVTKYIANWGGTQVEYKYEGYKDGELIKTIVKTSVSAVDFTVKADRDALVEKETYDVVRVALEAVDQNGNRLPYDNDVFHVSVDGPAEVIGPDEFALVGGVRAFWLKSKGESGKITVTVSSRALGEKTIALTAEKINCD